jgi:RHS repeat-associated protein
MNSEQRVANSETSPLFPAHKLMDLSARRYDPMTALFTSVDELWATFPQQHGYHYAYHDPVNFRDPSGMEPGGDAVFSMEGANGSSGTEEYGPSRAEWEAAMAERQRQFGVMIEEGFILRAQMNARADADNVRIAELLQQADLRSALGPPLFANETSSRQAWARSDGKLVKSRRALLAFAGANDPTKAKSGIRPLYDNSEIGGGGFAGGGGHGSGMGSSTYRQRLGEWLSALWRSLFGVTASTATVVRRYFVPEDPGVLGHIFSRKVGHIRTKDPAVRQSYIQEFEDAANNGVLSMHLLPADGAAAGMSAFSKLRPDGTQVWVFVDPTKGIIYDAGINVQPKLPPP